MYKKSLIVILLTFSVFNVIAQTNEQFIQIKSSGKGNNKDEAINTALKNALSVTLGNNTSNIHEIINNIDTKEYCSYDLIKETELKDEYIVYISVKINTYKLEDLRSKDGSTVYVRGNDFVNKIKSQQIQVQSELETVESIYQNIESLAPYFYNFTVMPGSPLTLNQSKPEGNYKIPVKVTSTPNYYFNNMISYLFTVLNSINMSESEIENFKSVNKDIHKFYFKYNNSDYTFYLRSSESISLLTKSIRLLVESHNIFYLSDGKKINNQNFLKFTYFYFNNLNTANYNRYIIFDNNPQYNNINLVRSFQEISQMNKITVNSITNLKFQNNIITNKIKDINFYFDLVQFGNVQNYILRDLFKKIELVNREKPGGINNWRSATFNIKKIELNREIKSNNTYFIKELENITSKEKEISEKILSPYQNLFSLENTDVDLESGFQPSTFLMGDIYYYSQKEIDSELEQLKKEAVEKALIENQKKEKERLLNEKYDSSLNELISNGQIGDNIPYPSEIKINNQKVDVSVYLIHKDDEGHGLLSLNLITDFFNSKLYEENSGTRLFTNWKIPNEQQDKLIKKFLKNNPKIKELFWGEYLHGIGDGNLFFYKVTTKEFTNQHTEFSTFLPNKHSEKECNTKLNFCNGKSSVKSMYVSEF